MADVLAQSTSVKMIATSREGLGVADEQVWPVRSLDVETAADLFADRATTSRRTSRWTGRWWISAAVSMAFRWPSSWRHHGWRR
jgi:predicted ATPase